MYLLVWQQEKQCENPWQDCRSEWDKRSLRKADGPRQVQARHWPETSHRELRVHVDTEGTVRTKRSNAAMHCQSKVNSPPWEVGRSRTTRWCSAAATQCKWSAGWCSGSGNNGLYTHSWLPKSENCTGWRYMVFVQKLTKKTATVVTVKDLNESFNTRLMHLMQCWLPEECHKRETEKREGSDSVSD